MNWNCSTKFKRIAIVWNDVHNCLKLINKRQVLTKMVLRIDKQKVSFFRSRIWRLWFLQRYLTSTARRTWTSTKGLRQSLFVQPQVSYPCSTVIKLSLALLKSRMGKNVDHFIKHFLKPSWPNLTHNHTLVRSFIP